MARERTTPFNAQLERFLKEHAGEPLTFSAKSLAEVFDIPQRQKRTTTIGSIHRALRTAYADGKVVRFLDGEGHPLRESEHTAHGSAAVEHPEIFGLPGSVGPTEGFVPVTVDTEANYTATNGASPQDDEEVEPVADNPAGDSTEAPAAESVAEDRTPEERLRELADWTSENPAPEWMPDDLLEQLVMLPDTQQAWRLGLDKASREIKFALIRAGVKRRGKFAPVAARELARACRKHAALWEICVFRALETFRGQLGHVPAEDLEVVAQDPLGYADAHPESQKTEIALLGYVLGECEDTEQLALLAADAVDDEKKAAAATVEEALRHRAEVLEEELTEVRDELKREEQARLEAEKRTEALIGEVERAHTEHAAVDDATKLLNEEREALAKARAEAAQLRAKLESAEEDAERIPALEADAREAEGLRDELAARGREIERERELRAEAENQVQEELRRVRDLTQRLRQREQSSVQLPVDDAKGLISALGPSIGQAAQQAAARLADGRAEPDDFRLLKLAAAYGELSAEAGRVVAPGAFEEPDAWPAHEAARSDVADREPTSTGAAEGPPPEADEALDEVASDAAEVGAVDEPAPVVAATTDLASATQEARADGEVGAEAPPIRGRIRRAAQPVFTIRAIGGAEEVGGSAILVQTHDGSNVLLDAGQRVKGEYGAEDVGQYHYGVSGVERLDGVLISHAHIDHVGSLPLVVDAHSELQGAPVPVWMSEPTAEIARIMLRDSAKIQEARTRMLRDLGESDLAPGTVEAAYTIADVERVMDPAFIRIAEPAAPIAIPGTDLVAKFFRVAHVLGSCAIHLRHRSTGASLLYTGDLGPFTEPQATLPDFGGTNGLEAAELVIMESTYAFTRQEEAQGRRRIAADRERAVQILGDHAEKAIEKGGFVLLPAFSLGRTQELVKLIGRSRGRELPEGRIYLGGMGEKILQIYDNWGGPRRGGWARPGEFPPTSSVNGWLGEDGTFDEAAHEILANEEPGYLIVTPAMLSGGWSRAFLRAMVGDDRHLVAFTGYLPRHAGGIPHIERARTNGRLRLGEEGEVTIRADWLRLEGLSAHAPARDLRKFATEITQMNGGKAAIACVHGEASAQAELAQWVEEFVDGATGHSLHRNDPWRPDRP